MISHKRLTELLDYDSFTGVFTNRITRNSRAVKGDIAGSLNCEKGYIEIGIDGTRHLGHNLAWFYIHEKFPTMELDHKDQNRSNNAIDNLRLITRQGNNRNHSRQANNTSGYVGVHLCKETGKWRAMIKVDGKNISLGRHIELKDAISARLNAERDYGFDVRHGMN